MSTAHKLAGHFEYNPHAPGFVDDPYPTYRLMRERYPVYGYRTFRNRQFMLTRYRDIKETLLNKSMVVDHLGKLMPDARHMGVSAEDAAMLRRNLGRWLLFIDPPDHGRLRNLVRHDFAFSAIEKLRPFVEEQADRIFEGCAATGRMEVVSQLAQSLPAATVGRLLGVADGKLLALAAPFRQLAGIFEQPLTLTQFRSLVVAAKELRQAVLQEIDARRGSEAHDILTAIARSGQMSCEDEMIGFVYLLIVAGLDTTEAFIANGINALLANREQFRRLCDNPDLIDGAALELARYDSPVQFLTRIPSCDLQIEGTTIPAGSRMFMCLGSANRDEAQFADPDRLDIARPHAGQLAFGGGIHFCLGREVALLQMRAILRRLVAFPEATVEAGSGIRRPRAIVFRGFRSLMVNLASAGCR
ncbi:MAG TPA: cytochrome P450 [Steroidobacteraceae bacterium]|nr:cytochrome P450 [Steroidobacteraceae bacterium]